MKPILTRKQLSAYARLMRLNRPIGIYLVLWPTLWALWLAAEGFPDISTLLIFCLGVVLMRSAGCVINDYADRNIDGHVSRTADRPLVTGEVSPKEALFLFAGLCGLAFLLVLFTNRLTIYLAFGALALAMCYPFMKRYTHLPQVVLGAAFAWAVPMAFAAQSGKLEPSSWLVYTAVVLWTVAYDTFYAMADREEDLKIGVKSTAILLGDMDRMMIGSLQALMMFAMFLVGGRFSLSFWYYLSLAIATVLFVYQHIITQEREPKRCIDAFLNNNLVGLVLFIGIVLGSF
ncbi:MAG: 4-hydroxybenzoate octaprenyltransferase [Alteromonadaceae bacterium]|nr:MAG: 4-hydroxybenzoate octaprenyltransferase [Alteromonadaceae bacterium]